MIRATDDLVGTVINWRLGVCDTLVALGSATVDGSTILAKNSDREPNEAHILVRHPHAVHEAGSTVHCTYIEIPQMSETYEVTLCKPFWLWGCEMGANEKGVAIGNEAVFTKEPYAKSGLLGMDLIRLALERADTAEGALHVLTDLLGRYGQGGAAGYLHKGFMYHNSFLIADHDSAWVLETAGEYWAAEQVKDVRTISNRLTIHNAYDLASPGLVEHAIEKGWCRSQEDFDFARCYSDRLYTTFSMAHPRQSRTTELLRAKQGHIDVPSMMEALRDHGNSQGNNFSPASSSMASICMHAANELTRSSQSVGSMVAHLNGDRSALWLTGTSAPCTSVFKPVALAGTVLPDHGAQAGAVFDPASLWWRHEQLHRAILRDYDDGQALYAQERDALEKAFRSEVSDLMAESDGASPSTADWEALSQRCFDRATKATDAWIERIGQITASRRIPMPFDLYWRKQARQAKFAR